MGGSCSDPGCVEGRVVGWIIAAAIDSVKNLLELDGYEFEDLILLLFKAIPDFDEVRKTRSRADGGIDVVAVNKKEFTGGRVAIQAKRYATPRAIRGKWSRRGGPGIVSMMWRSGRR
jgi:hypothetical protein